MDPREVGMVRSMVLSGQKHGGQCFSWDKFGLQYGVKGHFSLSLDASENSSPNGILKFQSPSHKTVAVKDTDI